MLEANFHRWDVEIINCPIFESGGAIGHVISIALYRCDRDRATCKPWPMQFRQSVSASEQYAQAGWITEHFIKRDRNKIGLDETQIQSVCGNKRGSVEQNIPAMFVCFVDPIQGMLNRRKIGLRGIGKEIVSVFRRLSQLAAEL